MTDVLQAALTYARNGKKVFPVHSLPNGKCSCGDFNCTSPGKHPRTAHGFKDATTNVQQIVRWWTQWPDANIGIPTGQASNIVVLDIDPRNGGTESFYQLIEKFGRIPETLSQKTGGQGSHFFFEYPKGVALSTTTLNGYSGLDTKADGGYILVPPSKTKKPYAWVDPKVKPAPLPPWLLDLIIEKAKARAEPLPDTIATGRRNEILTSIAGSLRRPGMSREAMFAALKVENKRCVDNDTGEAAPLDEQELRGIVQSVGQYQPAPNVVNEPVKIQDKEEASSRGFKLTPLGDLLNEEDEEIPWLVAKHLPSAGLSILGGKPKAGKSVLTRCLALNVARGTPFLGFETAQGSVFYLGLEEKRSEVKAHFQAMGATPDDPIFVFIAPSPQDGVAQLHKAAEEERPALIIVDPILKMVRVKDGNDYATMSNALEPLLTLARQTGAHVLGVHHLSKGERSRGDSLLGSTAIFAAPDTALFYKRSERYRTLSSIQRYGEDLEEIVLVMDPETKIISAGGERGEVDERQVGQAILEYLKDLKEPIKEKEIHDGVEGRRNLKIKALRALFEQDKVVRTGGGKKGNPYLYFVSGVSVPPYRQVPEYQEQNIDVSAAKESTYSGTRPDPISAGFPDPRVPANSPLSERPKEAIKGTFGDLENDDDIEFVN